MKGRLSSLYPLLIALIFGSATSLWAGERERTMNLGELFQLADSVSLTLKSAESQSKVADAAVTVSKNGLLPDINFTASATYNGNAWMADRDFSNGQNLDISNQRQRVRFLLTGYYLNLYKFRNMLGVVERNIERTEQVIKDMRAREEQGLVLSNDITRYEVQLQNLRYRRTELMSQIDIFNNQLVTTLNLPADTQIMPDTELLNLSLREYSEAELHNIAEAELPLLKIGRTNIDISHKQEQIARAGMIPKISVFAGDRLQGPLTMELPPINKNLNTWYVGVGLSFNFDNLYKSQRDVNRTRLSTAAAKSRYAETKESVYLEIHQAYVNYRNAFELLHTQEKSL